MATWVRSVMGPSGDALNGLTASVSQVFIELLRSVPPGGLRVAFFLRGGDGDTYLEGL